MWNRLLTKPTQIRVFVIFRFVCLTCFIFVYRSFFMVWSVTYSVAVCRILKTSIDVYQGIRNDYVHKDCHSIVPFWYHHWNQKIFKWLLGWLSLLKWLFQNYNRYIAPYMYTAVHGMRDSVDQDCLVWNQWDGSSDLPRAARSDKSVRSVARKVQGNKMYAGTMNAPLPGNGGAFFCHRWIGNNVPRRWASKRASQL